MNFDLNINFDLPQWLKANKLSLNVTKTELIIFHSSSKKIDHSLKFKLDGKRLTPTRTVKYLCVLLNNHLLWSKQINHVSKKLIQAIGILSKLRNNTSLYGSQLWGHTYRIKTKYRSYRTDISTISTKLPFYVTNRNKSKINSFADLKDCGDRQIYQIKSWLLDPLIYFFLIHTSMTHNLLNITV